MPRLPLLSKEELLEAGRAAIGQRGNHSLVIGEVIDLQVADVLDAAAASMPGREGSRRRLSPSVLYTHWDSFDDYLRDLVPSLFSPEALDLTSIRSTGSISDRLLKHARADFKQASAENSSVYFGAFRAASIPEVRAALKSVYESFDTAIKPELAFAFESAGTSLSQKSINTLAAALTALTEGLALRSLVDDTLNADEVIELAIFAIVSELTRNGKSNHPRKQVEDPQKLTQGGSSQSTA